MTHIYKTNQYFALGLMLALLSGIILCRRMIVMLATNGR